MPLLDDFDRPRWKFSAVQRNWAKLAVAAIGTLVVLFILTANTHKTQHLQIAVPSRDFSAVDSLAQSSPVGSSAIVLTPPLTRQTLGHATWALLHTIASTFPDKPTHEEREAARSLISSLSVLYSCRTCRSHFQQFLAGHPVTVDSREEFVGWLCNFHNAVNRRLGKTELDCATAGVYWPNKLKASNCGCNAGEDEEEEETEKEETHKSQPE